MQESSFPFTHRPGPPWYPAAHNHKPLLKCNSENLQDSISGSCFPEITEGMAIGGAAIATEDKLVIESNRGADMPWNSDNQIPDLQAVRTFQIHQKVFLILFDEFGFWKTGEIYPFIDRVFGTDGLMAKIQADTIAFLKADDLGYQVNGWLK